MITQEPGHHPIRGTLVVVGSWTLGGLALVPWQPSLSVLEGRGQDSPVPPACVTGEKTEACAGDWLVKFAYLVSHRAHTVPDARVLFCVVSWHASSSGMRLSLN